MKKRRSKEGRRKEVRRVVTRKERKKERMTVRRKEIRMAGRGTRARGVRVATALPAIGTSEFRVCESSSARR
jgi:hypothetical protein